MFDASYGWTFSFLLFENFGLRLVVALYSFPFLINKFTTSKNVLDVIVLVFRWSPFCILSVSFFLLGTYRMRSGSYTQIMAINLHMFYTQIYTLSLVISVGGCNCYDSVYLWYQISFIKMVHFPPEKGQADCRNMG